MQAVSVARHIGVGADVADLLAGGGRRAGERIQAHELDHSTCASLGEQRAGTAADSSIRQAPASCCPRAGVVGAEIDPQERAGLNDHAPARPGCRPRSGSSRRNAARAEAGFERGDVVEAVEQRHDELRAARHLGPMRAAEAARLGRDDQRRRRVGELAHGGRSATKSPSRTLRRTIPPSLISYAVCSRRRPRAGRRRGPGRRRGNRRRRQGRASQNMIVGHVEQ